MPIPLQHLKQRGLFDFGGIYENVTLEEPDINFTHSHRAHHQKTILSISVFLCADDASFSRAVVFHFTRSLAVENVYRVAKRKFLLVSLCSASAHQKNKERRACRFSLSAQHCCKLPLLLFRAIKLNLEHFSAAPRAACAGY